MKAEAQALTFNRSSALRSLLSGLNATSHIAIAFKAKDSELNGKAHYLHFMLWSSALKPKPDVKIKRKSISKQLKSKLKSTSSAAQGVLGTFSWRLGCVLGASWARLGPVLAPIGVT